jgi:hypothetical protein
VSSVPEKLAKLVEVFNADEDTTVDLKRTATKIGAEITMALAMSHGEENKWEKVSS